MAKFLKIGTSGLVAEESTVTTGGGANANKVPALDSNGQLAESMMPSGIGADTVVVPTSENLSANEIVNLYNNSGAITARKADAGINKYQANGYVKASTTAPANVTIFLDGSCPGTFAAADAGKPVFLSDTAGTTTLTPVSGSGKLHQLIGYVTSTTGFDFEVESPIELV